MKSVFTCVLLLSSLTVVAVSQEKLQPAGSSSIKLSSPYVEDGHGKLKHSEKVDRNCFDFVSEAEVPCAKRWDIVYGNLRAGEEWDWFYVPASNRNSRSRMVSLGKKDWADVRKLPEIDPLPKLKPGEKRVASVDASGAKGADGTPGRDGAAGANGMNGDGTVTPSFPEPDRAPIEVAAQPKLKPVTTSSHFIKVVKGAMYVLRVVDDEHDFYVLLRVDDLVRGRTATISWKKFAAL